MPDLVLTGNAGNEPFLGDSYPRVNFCWLHVARCTSLCGVDWIDELQQTDKPFELFDTWFHQARKAEPDNPEAMTLGTTDQDGCANLRTVLMRGHGTDGFVFYSNGQSTKGVEIEAFARAALLFHWKSLERQVRIRGELKRLPDEMTDAYFASRPYASRIGARASDQSRPLTSRALLEERIADQSARYPENGPVPRPPYWIGYRLIPLEMEFWQGVRFRLHERVRLERRNQDDKWRYERLYP